MPDVNILRRVYRPFLAFRDRADAGRRLVEFVSPVPHERSFVLALPRGGVPVAAALADAIHAPLDLAMVRKLPLPHSPEAGFGAVAIDGSRVLNEPMVEHFGLSQAQIEAITVEVAKEIRRRARQYAAGNQPPALRGLHVYLVDDGLASGYSMVAAARMVRAAGPESLVLCVPVSPWDSLLTVRSYFEELHVLYVQEKPPFAVASYYQDFHDLSDDEVRDILQERSLVAREPNDRRV